MNKTFRPLIAFLTLSITILACALPIPSIPPAGAPTQSNGTATPPFSPDQVGTVVALTLTGIAPGPGTTPGSDGSASVLPHSFYYLGTDSAGLTQVFRIDSDGTTQHQITSEPVNVNDYDVSLVDGSIAYVANNQLLWINADGSNRRVIVDGGPVDPNNPFISNMSSPVFSPDGQTLAYGYKGLQLYTVSTGQSTLVIENQIDDAGGGLFVPRELYSPERYSPDGTKLLITLGYYEGASSAIYYPATNALVRLEGGEGALICCDDTEWSSDSLSVYAASPSSGMFSSGLWKVDAATGQVTTLIQGDAGGGNYNTADEPYLGPDGQLYFFFATVASPDGVITRSQLQSVRSAPDGVTGRTVISTEDFQLLNEALWAPDASFVIAAFAPTREVYQGGQAEIIYFDGRPNVVLTPFAQQMKWGP
jgi:Tol biopolymer transport system component